jgi:hypothetical protein
VFAQFAEWSERARAANAFQNGNKVKQLRLGPTGHKFRGAASGAPRKNRTSETRRLARSNRDVAFASRRESVAEARPRCESGDRLTWTQPSLRQAQLVRQTTWRICSLKIAVVEMTSEGCGNEESLPYMILSAPHRDAATAGGGCSLTPPDNLTRGSGFQSAR